MDAATLDRLLIDRSLAALSPETELLLDAYLLHDPEAAARACDYANTVAAVRRTLGRHVPAALPAFPIERVRAGVRWHRQVLARRRLTGLAAALVIGVGVGAWLFRPPATVGPVAWPRGVVSTAGREPGVVNPAANGFWSAARLVTPKSVELPKSVRVIWDSPVMKPRLEGEL